MSDEREPDGEPDTPDETPAETPDDSSTQKPGPLVPQKHGGAIWQGRARNPKAGPGRPKAALRAELLRIADEYGIPFLEAVVAGRVEGISIDLQGRMVKLVLEYGLLGASGVSSVKYPVGPRLPYTSSVDTCTYFATPNSRAASSSTWVPSTFVRTNGPLSWMLRSTWLSAAKLITSVTRFIAARTSSRLVMSPLTKA